MDDHTLLRAGLKEILESQEDIIVVAEGVDGNDAIKISANNPYDLMILDISMPDKSGIDAMKSILTNNAKSPILILSMHPESQYAIRCLKMGASGYLSKKSAAEELVSAVRTMVKGKKYFSHEVAQMLAERLSGNDSGYQHDSLSHREFQTLRMMGSGLTQAEIAEKLNLSVKTVGEYRSRVMGKMSFKHNSELISYAIRNSLTPMD